MRLGEATKLINDTYKVAKVQHVRHGSVFDAVQADVLLEAFEALERAGDGQFVKASPGMQSFLEETYFRVTSRSSPVDQPKLRTLAPRVFRAFEMATGTDSGRVASLLIASARWRIANQRGYKVLDGWPPINDTIQEELATIESMDGLYDSGKNEIRKAFALLEGGPHGEVRSRLTFDLPHPLVRREAVVNAIVDELEVRVSISPTSSAPDVIDVQLDPPMILSRTTLGGGAWSPGTAHVVLTATGLIDWTTSVAAYEHGMPGGDRSPALPYLAVEVVRAVLNAISENSPDELDGRWMPVANDIRSYTFEVYTETEQLYFHRMDPAGVQGAVLDGPSVQIDLGVVRPPRPWQTARAYASGAMRSARHFDAVIWANVAVEAYIDERLDKISQQPGVDTSTLYTRISVFADAERIVREHRPDLADTFPWPSSEKASSRYRQIREAGKWLIPIGGVGVGV